LLRSAIAGLRAQGHRVSLLAPARPGAALLGPGGSAVDAVLDWDDPALLPLFAERDSPNGASLRHLDSFDACIAYTSREDLVARLQQQVSRTLCCFPRPERGHAAEWFATPARLLGAEPPRLPPCLQTTPTEETAAAAFLADRLPPRFLAIHAGSGGPAKNWPRERFAALAQELGDPSWLLVEGPAEEAESPAWGGAREGCVRARSLPLRILGAVLRQAGLFVGNDSGVSHLAAAFGAPTLALFGPTDPAVWSPVGRDVAVVRSPTTLMADISVSAAADAACRLRARAAGPLR
jgi:heptosyltransferase-3